MYFLLFFPDLKTLFEQGFKQKLSGILFVHLLSYKTQTDSEALYIPQICKQRTGKNKEQTRKATPKP